MSEMSEHIFTCIPCEANYTVEAETGECPVCGRRGTQLIMCPDCCGSGEYGHGYGIEPQTCLKCGGCGSVPSGPAGHRGTVGWMGGEWDR